jgi:hypothetical protein
MNTVAEFENIEKHLHSPGGLQNFGPYFILSLFTHPAIRVETIKDVNEMTDKFVFFCEDKVVYVLSLPCNMSFGVDERWTEKYKFLLASRDKEKKNG